MRTRHEASSLHLLSHAGVVSIVVLVAVLGNTVGACFTWEDVGPVVYIALRGCEPARTTSRGETRGWGIGGKVGRGCLHDSGGLYLNRGLPCAPVR